jgi:membrane-associated phospholipid phosphatase
MDQWAYILKPMSVREKLQGLLERLFFKGKRSAWAEAVTCMILNLLLMLIVFYFFLNTIVYNWTGGLYAQGFHLNTALDNVIPFVPEWAIIYIYIFYPLTAVTMIYFAFVEYRQGYALAWSLVLINAVADLVYLVFPVTTDIYRQALFVNRIVGNPFADAMYAHFGSDPSFNCFPSLHAAVSVICAYAWYRYFRRRPNAVTKIVAVLTAAIAVGVVLSTLFVKQHYIADEIAGIVLALGIGLWIYRGLDNKKPASIKS